MLRVFQQMQNVFQRDAISTTAGRYILIFVVRRRSGYASVCD
jgi:hypothetical protein